MAGSPQQNISIMTGKNRLVYALLGALAGLVVFLLLYGTTVLHPGWDAWILNGYDETDIQQHYAGWVLFRNSHWGFPLGLADTIALPDGTPISYTDSLPWVSIFFKLLRGALPATFQWFGLYTLFCFMMQGAAGALLVTRRACVQLQNRLLCVAYALLGGALFACLPTLWERAFRHVALASHYLYLFALYFYLEYRQKLRDGTEKIPWQFAFIAFVTIGIHPYFLPPVMLCALLAALDCGRITKQWGRGFLQFGISLAAAVVGGILCGALGGGAEVSRSGYGDFSMNLNAAFNPISRGGYTWSKLLPALSQQPGQYDGFNYLGLGVLVLTAVALLYSIVVAFRRGDAVKTWWRRNGIVFAVCVFLTMFALSNKIYLGNAGITLPLPQFLLDLCGIFRSSGRMFYLVGACIVLFAVYTLEDALQHKPAEILVVLAVVLALQVWDLSAVAVQKHAMLAADVPINQTVVNNEQTAELGVGHTRLMAVAPVREDRLRLLAILAGKQGLATNLDIAVSGTHPEAEASMQAALEQLQAGNYDAQTVYVTTDGAIYDEWMQTYAQDAQVSLFVADSCYFLMPIAG